MKRILTTLSLRRKADGLFFHVTTDGVWGTSVFDNQRASVPPDFTPLADSPELRALIGWGQGFECLGFYQNIATPVPGGGWRELGTEDIDYPGTRGFGAASIRERVLTSPLPLTKGHRSIVVKASPQKPVSLRLIAFVKSGRRLRDVVPDGFSTI